MTTAIALSPQLTLSGSPLSLTWQASLMELRVERALNVPARVTVRFADPGYALLQSGTVTLDATLQVTDPNGVTLFTGAVTAVGSEQREGEQPELVVVGHDKSYQLGLSSRVKTWNQTSVSTVVSGLLSSYGLSATVGASASATVEYLLQVDTDLGLLGELARRSGADWWVAGATLYFGKPSELAGNRTTVKLTLGEGLFSFSARALPAPKQVTVTGWDTVQQQTVTGQAASASTGVLATSTLAGLSNAAANFVTAAVGARSATEASTLSQALFDLRAAAAVEASGTAAGDAAIAPGGEVTVSGAGPLSGTYPLTAVEHVYRPRRGFVTRFRSGDRRPAGLLDGGRANGVGLTGSIIGHPGVTAGVVTNINDPTTTGRVKVRFPGMSSTQESAWARVVAMGGGKTRGNVFIPEVDDEVLVAFEDGDTRRPVVIGGLYGSKSAMPATTLTGGKVQKRALVSRLGHVVGFLDGTSTSEKAIELQLADKQNTVHLGADKTTVTVKQGNQLSITVGSTTITVAQGTGAVTITAPTIKLQAKQQIQLSAPKIAIASDGTLTLSGQGIVQVTGASVQVQAKAIVGITGTPVSINGG
jgi:phage protein D/phage baseplate assembly protein gpV